MRDSDRASEALKHCLVEEEGATLRSPRRRQVSLVLSVALQASVLATALLVPLLMNGEKLSATFLTPAPPYRRVPAVQDPRPPRKRSPTGHPTPNDTLFQPPKIPTTVADIRDAGSDAACADNVWIGVPDSGLRDGLLPRLGPNSPGPPPPKMQSPPGPVPVSEGVQQGKLVHRTDPTYTPFLKSIRLQGTVRLRALIARDGAVKEVEILSGHPMLAERARSAIQQWRYQPTLLNNQPVEVETQITVVFTIR